MYRLCHVLTPTHSSAVNDVRTRAERAACGTWIDRVRKLLEKFGEEAREAAA